ncbi:hypothetical protein DID88_000163 [Monilinia fructigena]|uniref:Linalool dehydratase/isomerase domain-containing protein n=1 Tax=Monilinia fructigena TaxID=38457 RepID=A0A395IJB1_9HELO|nr:hypothetical protein DID88_000163 [Monilinia fructigena]
MSFSRVATAFLAASATARAGSYVTSLPYNAQGLFNESMDYLDRSYDNSAGYLYDTSGSTALRHETRSSAWYAIGLLARNQGSDIFEAEKIILNVINAQYKDVEDQWYGDYQIEPEEPELGSSNYAPVMYNSWDPNWRGFIGTAFIIGLEEFGSLISPEVTSLMLKSLHNATLGDEYRSLMRAFVSGWTGRRLNDSNMTTSGENYAQQVIDLFDRANTLSEFNSGTYTGVSLFAMTLWAKYLPEDSVMKQKGPSMIQYTWEAVSNLWHPQLLNVAGPWDPWLANNISIGAETFNENVIGGPAKNQRTFNPALMQWNTGNGIGWLTLYATEKHVIAEAAAGSLNLTYPEGNDTSIFTFLVSPFAAKKKTISRLEDIQGLNLTVSGTIDKNFTLSYAGQYGGTDATINDFEYWNITFAMPAGSAEAPHIFLEVDLW